MKLTFTYDREKDISCLLQFGKTSMNSQTPTEIYESLSVNYGENPTEVGANEFITTHLQGLGINPQTVAENYQQDWNSVAEEYRKVAEAVFGVTLPDNVTAYLTINTRTPYNIEQNYFYVSFPSPYFRKTAMHELWHFYTWRKFGKDENRLGASKYNELKEALTVLLNVECKALLPEGVVDRGYPQHQELRKTIETLWEETKDIEKVWASLI